MSGHATGDTPVSVIEYVFLIRYNIIYGLGDGI